MKHNRLVYALPLACLLASAAASRLALAADYSSPSSTAGSTSGYSTDKEDRTMNADPARDQTPSARDSSSSTGAAMKDAAITAKVKSALLAERDLPSSQIKVQTNDGVVQLSGFLNSQQEIDHAVSVASNVKDVKQVQNNMQTK
jgi:osmotically-inducible protein OsmY